MNGYSNPGTFSGAGYTVPSVPMITIKAGKGGKYYAGYGGGGGGVIINNNVGPGR